MNDMKFSTSVDMALRILVYLAEGAESPANDSEEGQVKRLSSAPEVSRALQTSYNNVVRIINRLQNAGLLVTHAGRYGGVALALPADQINVYSVVTAIDGPTKLSPCSHQCRPGIRGRSSSRMHEGYGGFHNCEIAHCGIREELFQLSDQIDALLESLTLQTIMKRHTERQKRKLALQQQLIQDRTQNSNNQHTEEEAHAGSYRNQT